VIVLYYCTKGELGFYNDLYFFEKEAYLAKGTASSEETIGRVIGAEYLVSSASSFLNTWAGHLTCMQEDLENGKTFNECTQIMNLKIIDLIYLRANLARGFPEAIYIIGTQTGTPIFTLIFCFLLHTRLDILLKHEYLKL
jgi:hypothetical protein